MATYTYFFLLNKRLLQGENFFFILEKKKNKVLPHVLIFHIKQNLNPSLSSHHAFNNHLTNTLYPSECLWMLCLTCPPQKCITHTPKSQFFNHLWVFSLHRNLQLP